MTSTDMFWRRVDVRGHDACRLEETRDGWRLRGAAVFLEGDVVTCASYDVRHDRDWITRSARVSGWCGAKTLNLDIVRDAGGTWRRNGEPVAAIEGCIDVDLGFTPATNTTAIRRLNLEVGERQAGIAAWLDTADWRLKPLEQSYFRRSPAIHEYESPGHGYRVDLSTDESGLVTAYPGLWTCDR